MENYKIGCCVTSHGWGHAARVSGIMAHLSQMTPLEPVWVTQVPAFFFEQSFQSLAHYHSMETDVGFVQMTSLEEGIQQTCRALDAMYPLSKERIRACASLFKECSLIVCDISPLGILAARALSIPSVLVENFTWDRIYAAYLNVCPQLQPHLEYLGQVFAQADYHIQAQPFCYPQSADLVVNPVARPLRGTAEAIRREFLADGYTSIILLTMGGGGRGAISFDLAARFPQCLFLAPGYAARNLPANVRTLPAHSSCYHPDLVAAADVVVGKVGYSTTAEVVQAGTPFGYVERPMFPESPHLVRYITENMASVPVSREALGDATWDESLKQLLSMNSQVAARVAADGAAAIARFLFERR
ncbi:MAG: hypothetical protein CSA33_02470 [Desulfobulbus propionicus]|nr:MAG: hypothetical protein CSA33_02470 [Desulfobulbus propionicus]